MAPRYPLTKARVKLADIVSDAQYGGKVTIITRHGKDAAAVVPVASVQEESSEAKKPAGSVSRVPPLRKSKV